MNELIYEAIDKTLRKSSPNTSVSTVINNITSQCERQIEFKDVTEIIKLIEPQINNRNILKLLSIKEENTNE